MKNIKKHFRFYIALVFLLSLTDKIVGQCPNPSPDSLNIIVVWRIGDPVASYLSALSGRQLDYSAPSNARLIRIPYCNKDVVINSSTTFSYSGLGEAVGVIEGHLSSVSVGENYIVSIPLGDIQEPPQAIPLPSNLFSCPTQSSSMTSKVSCRNWLNPVKMAILDSGVDIGNTQLMSVVDFTQDIIYNTTTVRDSNGHGTNLAGIGYRKTLETHKLQIYKVLDKSGNGHVWHLIKAIDAATTNGSKIISISIVGYPTAGTSSTITPLNIAIQNAELNNVLIVAAAGNGSLNIDATINHVVPAGEPNPNILSIGSLKGCNNLTTASSFSNWGQTQVDIFTYGENLETWNQLGQIVNVSGTSYSNILAATAALQLWSNVPAVNRSYSSLKSAIINSADHVTNLETQCTAQGILNTPNALCLLSYICPVIPVELVSFSGQTTSRGIALNWVTANEEGIQYYGLEQSRDGKIFMPIGNQKPMGSNQSATYNFLDKNPHDGINYYRLKIVEANGTFKYSKIVGITYISTQQSDFKVYPNPFNTVLNLEWQGIKNQKSVHIELLNIVGRLVWSAEVENTEGGINQYSLPTQKLSEGIYWLKIGNQPFQKLIKQ